MNSQSENNTWLETLIQNNGQAMEEIQETPYQPIFYAVPKEWIENWMKLLEQAVEFQPTLYRLISLLATRQELEQMQVRQRQLLQAEKQDTLTTIRSTLQQDGKMREQFSTNTSKMLSDSLKAMEDTAQRLEQRIMKKVARASILSAVLSVLVCGVLLHLAG